MPLIHKYTFDQLNTTYFDLIGTANATKEGTVRVYRGLFGKDCMYLGTVDASGATCGSVADLIFTTGAFSFSFWYKSHASLPQAAKRAYFGNWTTSGNLRHHVFFVDTDASGTLKFNVSDNGTNDTNVLSYADSAVHNDYWHHIVITRNSTNYKLYFDNVLVDSTNVGPSSLYGSATGAFKIGLVADGGTWSLRSTLMDNLEIWDEELSVDAINGIFKSKLYFEDFQKNYSFEAVEKSGFPYSYWKDVQGSNYSDAGTSFGRVTNPGIWTPPDGDNVMVFGDVDVTRDLKLTQTKQSRIGTGTASSGETWAAPLMQEFGYDLIPGTIKVRKNGNGNYGNGTLIGEDDGLGNLNGVDIYTISGTIDYATGYISVTESGDIWTTSDTVDVDFEATKEPSLLHLIRQESIDTTYYDYILFNYKYKTPTTIASGKTWEFMILMDDKEVVFSRTFDDTDTDQEVSGFSVADVVGYNGTHNFSFLLKYDAGDCAWFDGGIKMHESFFHWPGLWQVDVDELYVPAFKFDTDNLQQNIGTATSTPDETFSDTLSAVKSEVHVVAGTVVIRKNGTGTYGSGTEMATDDGEGTITGVGITGTINYTTGAVSITESGNVFDPSDTVDVDYQTEALLECFENWTV